MLGPSLRLAPLFGVCMMRLFDALMRIHHQTALAFLLSLLLLALL
jgi:hypothetical protein